MPIVVRIDVKLARRKLGVGELRRLVGITPANLAVLKNGRAKAVGSGPWRPCARHSSVSPATSCVWEPE